MPRKRSGNGELPLPDGWDVGEDYDGKTFYIDHTCKQTTWVDPRDRFTKPQTFADCLGDELPFGWEQCVDHNIGVYYINHINQTNQLEDPRLQWRQEQQSMLKDYLNHAQDDLLAKKEIFHVKQQRLAIAKEEVLHLNESLAAWKSSGTSLNSTSSVGSTKYDPDLLKADVALAKNRVSRLKRELEQIRAEMHQKEKGVETLTQVEEKMFGNIYNLDQATEIMGHIRSIQHSLSSRQREKQDLMQSLARLKEEFLQSKMLGGSSPDVSTLSIPREKLSTASQTDLSGEHAAYNNQWGEMVRMRLRYDEARKHVTNLQEQLAKIEDQMIPGQTESDKDRLLLIQEKEQLLRELRSIKPKGRTPEEMAEIYERISQLESDLMHAVELSNKQISERLKLNEDKSIILQQLAEATRLTTYLESQLRNLSLSTLSVSSGSSRGSLGSLSASSKGSLASLSMSDIYLQAQSIPETNLPELHRRLEKLLQGHAVPMEGQCFDTIHEHEVMQGSTDNVSGVSASSVSLYMSRQSELIMSKSVSPGSSLSSLSPPVSPYDVKTAPPPPSYAQHMERVHPAPLSTDPNMSAIDYANLQARLSELSMSQNHPDYVNVPSRTSPPSQMRPVPHLPLNPSLTPSLTSEILTDLRRSSPYSGDSSADTPISNPPLSPISESSSGVCNNLSGGNTRSVSAAVSDESVAGDSGVFEASIKRSDLDEVFEMECAQVQVKFKYESLDGQLYICLEQARNLGALAFPDNCQVYINAALLPNTLGSPLQHRTQLSSECNCPKFNEIFSVPVPENKLSSKILQVHVWCVGECGDEECLGCAQVSLAEFNPKHVSAMWYNVLSFKFMQSDGGRSNRTSLSTSAPVSLPSSAHMNADKVSQLLEVSSRLRRDDKLLPPDGTSQKDSRLPSATLDSSYFRTSNIGVASVKEESSDESTIISSQTSTLTRNQGPEDMESHITAADSVESLEEEDEEEEEEKKEEEPQDPGATSFNLNDEIPEEEDVREESEDSLSPEGTIKIVTCDKETNTESEHKKYIKRRAEDATRGSTIRRSQTFSPSGRHPNDYICKLNRSDSDGSLKYRRGPFQRNTFERRSMRAKKQAPIVVHMRAKSLPPPDRQPMRTSIDLELDLQASQTKLSQLNDEIVRLKLLKQRMEEAKQKGDGEMPNWLSENDQLQSFLVQADKVLARQDRRSFSRIDEKAERMLKKVTKEAYKMRTRTKPQPDAMSFREKMAFFTTVNSMIPVIPSESDTEDEQDTTASASTTSTLTTTSVEGMRQTADQLEKALHNLPQSAFVDGAATSQGFHPQSLSPIDSPTPAHHLWHQVLPPTDHQVAPPIDHQVVPPAAGVQVLDTSLQDTCKQPVRVDGGYPPNLKPPSNLLSSPDDQREEGQRPSGPQNHDLPSNAAVSSNPPLLDEESVTGSDGETLMMTQL